MMLFSEEICIHNACFACFYKKNNLWAFKSSVGLLAETIPPTKILNIPHNRLRSIVNGQLMVAVKSTANYIQNMRHEGAILSQQRHVH